MFARFFTLKIFRHIVLDILYFPIWWYSYGLYNSWKSCVASVQSVNRSLGFTIWFRNIFTPMYQQKSFSGRIISFFMRLIQIIVRGIAIIVFIIISLIVFLIYPLLPILIVYQLYKTL